jgi:RimJ/RimL family protein N-acetyltransferase
MNKTETLKDGAKVTIRELHLDDLDRLMKFYAALPLEDRKYLRVDVTNRSVVEQRINLITLGSVFRMVALLGDEIIAEGALELSGEEWRKHQGELRIIVSRPFQHKGLGMSMVRELYFLAVEKNVELVVAKMMRPQVAALRIFRKLGFREEMLIPDYIRDMSGEPQDLVIMTCNIKDLWREIDHYYTDSDWQRCQ